MRKAWLVTVVSNVTSIGLQWIHRVTSTSPPIGDYRYVGGQQPVRWTSASEKTDHTTGYFADAQYASSIFAGGGPPNGLGATSIALSYMHGVAVDSNGNVYVPSATQNGLYKVATNGTITTVAGTGIAGYSGDNGAATSAQLNSPWGVAIDNATGNLYIADTVNSRIRKVSGGVITTVAGNGAYGYSGDNGPATSAQISYAYGVAIRWIGQSNIADTYNQIVREESGGTITTITGESNRWLFWRQFAGYERPTQQSQRCRDRQFGEECIHRRHPPMAAFGESRDVNTFFSESPQMNLRANCPART